MLIESISLYIRPCSSAAPSSDTELKYKYCNMMISAHHVPGKDQATLMKRDTKFSAVVGHLRSIVSGSEIVTVTVVPSLTIK